MQVPSAATVARTRYWIAVVARAIGTVAVAAAAFRLVWGVWEFYWRTRQIVEEPPGYWVQGMLEFVGPIAALAGLGVVLLRWGDRLAAIIAPDPGARCGRCGYSLEGATGHACPECGLTLAAAPAESAVRTSVGG